MGCLKLSVLDEQRKERAKEVRIDSKKSLSRIRMFLPLLGFHQKRQFSHLG